MPTRALQSAWRGVHDPSLGVGQGCPQAVSRVQGGGHALGQEVHPSHSSAQLDREDSTSCSCIITKFVLIVQTLGISCVDLN